LLALALSNDYQAVAAASDQCALSCRSCFIILVILLTEVRDMMYVTYFASVTLWLSSQLSAMFLCW